MPQTWPCHGCGSRTQSRWRRCRPCKGAWLKTEEGCAEQAWLASIPKSRERPHNFLNLGMDTANQGPVRMTADGRYRFLLTRRTGFGEKRVMFLMLNPSTADAVQNDPTIRRCMGFAARWECGWLYVVNLSPLRATAPADLLRAGPEPEEIWLENLQTIRDTAAKSDLVVVAYGTHGGAEQRAERVLAALDGHAKLHCLGTTRDGHPRHPLYVPSATKLALFRPGQ